VAIDTPLKPKYGSDLDDLVANMGTARTGDLPEVSFLPVDQGAGAAAQSGGLTIGNPVVGGSAGLPQTDWGNVAQGGIGAAGAAVGTIANLAGQKAAWDNQAAQNTANIALSDKMAKMQLGQQQNQFDVQQAFKALQWALEANKAFQNTGVGGRALRRSSSDLMGDVLRRIYLK
jgi:hypothetical protein